MEGSSWKRKLLTSKANQLITSRCRFLDKHEYYNKFPRFKDAPRDTILQNPIFRNHAAQLMFIINEAIENIEEPDVLKDKLNALGKAHAKRNIKPLQFEVRPFLLKIWILIHSSQQLKVVILDILKKTLKLRDEDHKAFVKMFDGLLPFIFEGMKKWAVILKLKSLIK